MSVILLALIPPADEQSQVKGHHALANILLEPPLSSSSNQTSSSLQHTLLSLRGASSARGEAHKSLAQELESRVLAGFSQWKERHEVRVRAARDELLSKSGVVGVWEKDVQRLNSVGHRATEGNSTLMSSYVKPTRSRCARRMRARTSKSKTEVWCMY